MKKNNKNKIFMNTNKNENIFNNVNNTTLITNITNNTMRNGFNRKESKYILLIYIF